LALSPPEAYAATSRRRARLVSSDGGSLVTSGPERRHYYRFVASGRLETNGTFARIAKRFGLSEVFIVPTSVEHNEADVLRAVGEMGALYLENNIQPNQVITLAWEQLKLLCRQRRFITHELANAKRRLTGLIDLSFPELSRHFDNLPSKAAHAVLKAAPNAAAIAGLSLRRLQGLLATARRGRFGAAKAKALKVSAKESLAARAPGSCSGSADPLDDRTAGILRTTARSTGLPYPEALLLHGSPDQIYPGHRLDYRAFDCRRTR
jgi:Putative sugar-binding domain